MMTNSAATEPQILTPEQAAAETGGSASTSQMIPAPERSPAEVPMQEEAVDDTIVVLMDEAPAASSAPSPGPGTVEVPVEPVEPTTAPAGGAPAPASAPLRRRPALRRSTKPTTARKSRRRTPSVPVAPRGLGAQAGLALLADEIARAEAVLASDLLRRLHALQGEKRRAAMAILEHHAR